MQFTLSSIVAVALALAASAAPNKLITVEKYNGKVVEGSYIVRLKEGVDKATLFDADPVLREAVTHDDWTVINGFAGQFDNTLLNKLRASDAVESIAEDGIVSIMATQTNAPWGIARTSRSTRFPSGSSATATNYTYYYPVAPANGQNVDVYVVDTGINLNHTDFGGRARFGWTGSGLAQTDDHGHGSHCAGTIGGTRWGVAKGVNLISVKVLNSAGSGTLANVVGGFNYVATAARASGRPSIASASLGGGASTAIDDSVAALAGAGVHAVIAAGNSNVNAANTSPARVASAITVGALDINDAKASFSNYGSVVDIWAPGVSITSTYCCSTTSTSVLSGTSMATPHVAGLVALYIAANGNGTPASVSANLWSTSGLITGLPSGNNNRLAQGPLRS